MAYDWSSKFKALYDKAVADYQNGKRGADAFFNSGEQAFLASIGATAQEIYDFAEDAVKYGEPDFSTCLLVTAARRDYFLVVQKGSPSGKVVPTSTLPAKTAAVDGIEWLPRIIEKARIKLRGEMDPDLMFGCGGDRNFLKACGIAPADFLRHVWAAEGDDRKVIDYVKACKAGK